MDRGGLSRRPSPESEPFSISDLLPLLRAGLLCSHEACSGVEPRRAPGCYTPPCLHYSAPTFLSPSTAVMLHSCILHCQVSSSLSCPCHMHGTWFCHPSYLSISHLSHIYSLFTPDQAVFGSMPCCAGFFACQPSEDLPYLTASYFFVHHRHVSSFITRPHEALLCHPSIFPSNFVSLPFKSISPKTCLF